LFTLYTFLVFLLLNQLAMGLETTLLELTYLKYSTFFENGPILNRNYLKKIRKTTFLLPLNSIILFIKLIAI